MWVGIVARPPNSVRSNLIHVPVSPQGFGPDPKAQPGLGFGPDPKATTPLGPTTNLAQGRCAKAGDPPQVDPKYASWTGVNENPGLGGFLGRGGSCPESLKLY